MYRPTDDYDARLLDPARLDPAVLSALLARHGWRRRGGAAGHYARWTPPGGAGGTSQLGAHPRPVTASGGFVGVALA
ncbi:hypothetical protein ACFVJH_38000, partial [Streptomyces decoyicus]